MLEPGHWHGWEKRHYLNPLPIHRIERRWMNKFSRAKAMALADLSEGLSDGERKNSKGEDK